jgi:hypothetical protein
VPEESQQPDSPAIDLKDPAFAALLAWLLPGLGHWYQGRKAKAVLFFVCIMGLFCFGLYLSSSKDKCYDSEGKIGYGRAVYFAWNNEERRLPYLCQIGVGLPALPALAQAIMMDNHRKVLCGGFMAPPRAIDTPRADPNYNQPTAHDLSKRLAHYLALAEFFTMVAGLLNVLAIYDALAGPVVIQAPAKKEKEEDQAQEEEPA